MAGAERFSAIIEAQTRGTQEVQKLEEALTRLMNTADKAGKQSSGSIKKATDDMRGSLDSLKGILQDPFGAATQSAENFVLKFGKVGVVAAGATAAIGAAAAAAFMLAKHTGELAEQQSNAAQILGLSIKDYGQFAQASENAGVSSDLLATSMRGLSKALSAQDDEGKKAKRALDALGVSGTDAFGAVRPMKGLLLEIADSLGKIQNPAERADAAMKVFGRAGLQLIPLFNRGLRESLAEMEKLGVGFDDFGAKAALNFDSAMDRMTTRMKTFFKDLGVAIAEASGFEDPGKTAADAASRAAERRARFELFNANNSGRALTIDPATLMSATSGARTIASTSQDQLASQLKASAQTKIRGLIEGKDAQSKLAAARKDLDDAVAAADVAAVTRLQGQIKGLERLVEAEAKAKALREKYEQYYLPEKLGPNINTSTRVPSLLSGRERILRGGAIGGAFIVDPKAYADANAGRQSAGLEQGAASAAGSEARRTADLQRQFALISQTTDLEIRRVQVVARTGEEVKVINETTALRLLALQQEADLGRNLRDVELERTRIVKERELEILQIKKQQSEQGRNTATSLFDAAVSGGQGLRSFITSQALGIPRTIAGNLGAEMGGLTGKLSLGLGGLGGRLLAGTPFGADPMKAAGDLQLTAAQIQLQAAQINAGKGTAGSIGSIFGGATNNPFIFNAVGGGGGSTTTIPFNGGIWGTPTGVAGKSNLGRNIGIGGLVAGGAFGAYSGFSAGGAQGALTGTSSLAGMSAGILSLAGVSGPAAPIVTGIGMAMGVVSALLGDPKKKEAGRIDRMIEGARFDEPTGRNYISDIGGAGLDYDRRGNLRITNQTVINLPVQAIDTQDLMRRGPEFAESIAYAINGGQAGGMVEVVRQNI